MFEIEAYLDQQITALQKGRPTVLFVDAADPRVLEAALHLTRFIRPVFCAPETVVRETIQRELGHVDPDRVAYGLSESTFIDAEHPAGFPVETPDDHGGVDPTAVPAPVALGIRAVRLGHADMLVGGASLTPREFLRPALVELAARDVTAEIALFVLPDDHPMDIYPGNVVLFGDVGINDHPTCDELAALAVEICAEARELLPEDPWPFIRGAIISYSHKGSDDGPSPQAVRKAMEIVPEILRDRAKEDPRLASIRIEGEAKINVVLSPRSAACYGRDAEWRGGVNVLILPNLEMGNMLANLYSIRFPTAHKFSVVVGADQRLVNLCMDCNTEDVRLSVKAAVLRLFQSGAWEITPKDTFFPRHRILAINPGSTSTKISVYEGENEAFTVELQHSAEELAPFEGQSITAQYAFRKEVILKALKENGFSLDDIAAVSARGGLIRPVPHGTLRVNQAMLDDLAAGIGGEHASNLGAPIAAELVGQTGKAAFIVDPVVVDEVPERVRVTGFKCIRRKVVSHALNQIASARRYAEENETFYERLNLIVAHMGGGITIGAHKKGHYIDVNNGLDGEGPFTPQRSGSLPVGQLIDLCFSGTYSKAELKKLNKGRGGLIDLLGTADLREVERRVAEGDAEAGAVFEAMAYQIAKWATCLLPAFDGECVDRIILTGGMARCKPLVAKITKYVSAVGCGVTVYPGENEMYALVKGALRVLTGKEEARVYGA